MSPTETRDRPRRLRRAMAAAGVDLLVLGPGSHMRWLLGFRPHPDERACLLFISADRTAFVMPALNAEDCAAKTDIALYRWADEHGPGAALKQALGHVGAGAARLVALDETLRADHALLALDALPGAARCYAQSLFAPMRMLKNADELATLRASAAVNDRAIQAAFAAVAPGVSEREIAAAVKKHFLDHGATPGFDIIGGGPNGAYPHHATSERCVNAGEPVLIDIGGVYRGYPSDMTRMAFAGEPSDAYRAIHAIVERALAQALASARPGVEAKSVDAAARCVIAEAGYGDYFNNRVGHGLGLDLHEPPYLSATSDTRLAAGMVFSIEPGIYLPGRFGVRLEEIVHLSADGPEILSGLGRDVYRGSGDAGAGET